MSVATTKFSVILWGFAQLMKLQARRHEKFRRRLRERDGGALNVGTEVVADKREIGHDRRSGI